MKLNSTMTLRESSPHLKGLLHRIELPRTAPEPVAQTNIYDAGSSLDWSPTLVEGLPIRSYIHHQVLFL